MKRTPDFILIFMNHEYRHKYKIEYIVLFYRVDELKLTLGAFDVYVGKSFCQDLCTHH